MFCGTLCGMSLNPRLLNFLILGVFDVGLAILLFQLVDSATGNHVYAYLAASIGPLIGGIIQHVRQKSFSGISALILAFNLAAALATLVGGTDERLLLVKGSVITGIFGLLFLGSLALGKPLAFYFGQRFGTDGTEEGVSYWNGLWKYPTFRASQRYITIVWGVVFLLEAIIRIVAAYSLPFTTAYWLSNALPFVALAICLTATFVIASRTRKSAPTPA